MKGMTKVVKCIKCDADIEMKAFRCCKAKYVFGQGYICEACANKEKEGNQSEETKSEE